MSKREAENKDSLPITEVQPPKMLNLDKSVSTTTENSDHSIDWKQNNTFSYIKSLTILKLAILLTKIVTVIKPTVLRTRLGNLLKIFTRKSRKTSTRKTKEKGNLLKLS